MATKLQAHLAAARAARAAEGAALADAEMQAKGYQAGPAVEAHRAEVAAIRAGRAAWQAEARRAEFAAENLAAMLEPLPCERAPAAPTNPPLEDMTPADRRHGWRWEGDRPQVIFCTGNGLDYCRETGPAAIRTHDKAAAWARLHFARIADSDARRVVGGFRVEWF